MGALLEGIAAVAVITDGIRPYGSYAIANRCQIFSRRFCATAFALVFFGQGLALA
jgi:hypothetical protein